MPLFLPEGCHQCIITRNPWSSGSSLISVTCLDSISEVNLGVHTSLGTDHCSQTAFRPVNSSVVYKLQSRSFIAFRAASYFFHSVTLFKFMWFYLVLCANTYVHISFLERLLLNSKLPTVSCSDLEWSGLVGEPDPWYLLPKPFLQVNGHTGHHTQ